MRIEANTPAGYMIKMVWHCEECRRLTDCAWADTDTAQYGVYITDGSRPFGAEIPIETRQAKKIVLADRIIYINPADEQPDEDHAEEENRHIEHA